MSNSFDINILAENFEYFRVAKDISIWSIDSLEKYKHDEEFMNLYNYIIYESNYVDVSIIPLLDFLLVDENLLYRLVNLWDGRDAELAYFQLKKYPYLMNIVNKFDFSDWLYLSDLIKVLSDIDSTSEIFLNIDVKCREWQSGEYESSQYDFCREFKGEPTKVIRKILKDYKISDKCCLCKLEVDGQDAFKTVPFIYFIIDDY